MATPPSADSRCPQERFLAVLDPDPLAARQEYLLLRVKLRRYFERNHTLSPDDLADEVICRALALIVAGRQVYAADARSYFFGVARNILREARKRPPEPLPLSDDLELATTADTADQRLLLSKCLDQLSDEHRGLIIRYFFEGADRLREELGISPNALRIRVHRIVMRLEHWAKTKASLNAADRI